MLSKKLFQRNKFLGILLMLMSVCATHMMAQTNLESPTRGVTVGNAYAAGDFENINMTNGNLMLNFPLGSLPKGRGGAGGSIHLVYNSKLWDLGNEKYLDDRWNIPLDHKNRKIIKQNTRGGWRLFNGYSIEIEDRQDLYGGNLPQCQLPNNMGRTQFWEEMTYRYKVRVVLPDGSSHEMIPYGHVGDVGGYYRVRMNGEIYDCEGSYPYQNNGRPVYYSVDGSYLRLETTQGDGWTLYFPDGSKVVDGSVYYDRNGNSVNYTANSISDNLGRSVVINWNVNGATQVVSKGVGGEDLIWTIKWKQIAASKTYATCEQNVTCPEQYWFGNVNNVSWQVVDEIIQPEQMGGGSYVFNYNGDTPEIYMPPTDGWGELSGVTLPSGANIGYTYSMDGQDDIPLESTRDIINNRVTGKTLTYDQLYDGVTTQVIESWGYPQTHFAGGTESEIVGPDGGSTKTVFFPTEPETNGFVPWYAGLARTSYAPDGSKTENLWENNLPVDCVVNWHCPGGAGNLAINPYIKASFTSLKNSSGNYTTTAIKEFTYDKNGNVTEVKEYDEVPHSNIPRTDGFVTGMPSSPNQYLKRISRTEYYNPTPEASSPVYNDGDIYVHSWSKRALRLPSSAKVLDASEVIKSYSEITYDHTEYSPINNNTKVGNPTLTRMWDSAKSSTITYPLTDSNSIKTQATYNSYGMPLTTTDANLNVTNITYGCIDGAGSCSADLQNLYPTKIETAYGTAVERTTTSIYDFYTGVVKSVTDVDNSLTVATDHDDLGRPVKVITAPGRPGFESWVRTEYDDVNRKIVVRADLETVGDGKKVSSQFFDEIGRVRLTKTLEDAATQSATNETDGIKVQTRYKTLNSIQNGYTYQLTSNPYRAATSGAASSEETMGWTLAKSWPTGKKQTVETFSGAGLPAAFGGSDANSTGVVTTESDTYVTTVEDQAGKKRRSVMNGLGQLIRVDEPDGSGALGTVGSPNQPTSYVYDILGNLKTVDQGDQERTFTYSSLSRLLSANNPESGTIGYEYDDNGNLTEKTDARGVVTSYTYDYLSRVKTRTYSGESGYTTPNVTYTYDNKTYAKGKLTKVHSSISATEYTEFDELGRVEAHKQTTDGEDYVTGYTYNLSGALIEQTYPTGRVVKNTLDIKGDLARVMSKQNEGSLYWAYANNFTYNPAGAVTSMELGNGNWESTQFNARLQPTQIALGTTESTTNLLDLDYDYGEWNGTIFNQAKNNGNVSKQVITVPTVGLNTGISATQIYTYDSLNRLGQATEYSGGLSWQQTFAYDRYGNRRFEEAGTTTLPKACLDGATPVVCPADRKVLNPTLDTANNRIVLDQDSDTNPEYGYDAGGSVTKDPVNSGRTFKYDGENKMVEVKNSSNVTVGLYYYDGDGKRVKKVVTGGETTVFVYDAAGKMIGEYSTELNQTPQVSYLTTDALGSPRINTDENGAVISRHDYHPFGEDIVGIGGRTQGLGYQSDDIRKQFTGYERDDETDLDFAQARYYHSNQGRFTTVDPLMASADLINPQTFNRYIYVGNNPVNITDPTGLIWGMKADLIEWFDSEKAMLDAGYSETSQFVGWRNGQLFALNPNSSVPLAVPNPAAAIQELVRLGVGAAGVIASGAALGMTAAVVATIAIAAIGAIYAKEGWISNRPESVNAYSGHKYQEDFYQRILNKAHDDSNNSNKPTLGGESSPADPNSRKPKDEENTPTKSGVPLKLTKEQISQSRIIARGNGIRDVQRLVGDYGGRASDWVKKSSPITEINGKRAEIHWYQNKAVGKVELKVKFLN